MYHVCIYTESKNEKFIAVGGFSEAEIQKNLQKIVDTKFSGKVFNKLVIFKSYMMDEEGEIYLNYLSKFEQRELAKFVISENFTFSDMSKHLVNQ